MGLRLYARTSEAMKFDDTEVQQFLADSMVARVATISARRTPQLMPLYFVRLDDKLYMNNATTSPTVRNIAANPRVVLLFEADRGRRRDRCLRITGVATFRQDKAIARRVSLRAALKYQFSPAALLSTLRNARKLLAMKRYRAERSSGMIEVAPESAEFLPMPGGG
jgi:nitroimidazol reductase NimA-like FMN-containing flavoprotein (pyridoxamine 5'-phosphate oxidase superfamily)